jgi:hypothetical protein
VAAARLVLASLFVLLAFLEESLRNFDILHDQRMSFRHRGCELVTFTVALGTLDKTEYQHFGDITGDIPKNSRR